MNLRNRLLMVVFLLVGAGFCPTRLSAVQISPTVQLFSLPRGGEKTSEATLTNNDYDEISVKALASDWHVYPANPEVKAADWLKVNAAPFKLKKGESKVVPFRIVLPKKAVGEVMAMLSFDTKSPATGDVTFRISVAVYAAIKGTEKVDAQVVGLAINPSSNTAFGYLLENKGNIHLRPHGFMRVMDGKGTVIANIVFKEEQPVHPGESKGFFQTLKGFRLPEGRYSANLSLSDADRGYELPVFKKKFSVSGEGKVKTD